MKEADTPTNRWQLKRQDDHGNQYVIGLFASKEKAAQMMADYEAKGHKQTYWIEKISGPLSSKH